LLQTVGKPRTVNLVNSGGYEGGTSPTVHLVYCMIMLYAGPSGMICQFWLFTGQCKSADQRKLLYVFRSQVAICVGDAFD